MNKRKNFGVFAGLFVFVFSFGGAVHAKTKQPYPVGSFDVKRSNYFSNYNSVVGRYLQQHSPRKRAIACVVGLSAAGQKNDTAWVIWRGGHQLILWWGGGDDNLNRSNRILDMRRDVVANDAAVGTSTYRVSSQWVASLERECKRYNRYVAVN
jgi:hypothetical protein